MNLSNAICEGVITLQTRSKWQPETPSDYATPDHFCRIFWEDMHSLYLLAFLLTANHAQAERCFAGAFQDAINHKAVFVDRARYWSRRAVINQAIRIIASAPSNQEAERWSEAENESTSIVSAIAQLAALDRAIFVLSILEHYSEWECVTLLDRSREDVRQARMRALQQLPALYLISSLPPLAEPHDRNHRKYREHKGSAL